MTGAATVIITGGIAAITSDTGQPCTAYVATGIPSCTTRTPNTDLPAFPTRARNTLPPLTG
jgi:hypothetical protein